MRATGLTNSIGPLGIESRHLEEANLWVLATVISVDTDLSFITSRITQKTGTIYTILKLKPMGKLNNE